MTMSMPLRDEGAFDISDESLIAELDEISHRLQAIREHVASRARARARAARLVAEPRVQDLILKSAKRHANGTLGRPDPPEMLNERLDRLTHH